MKRIANNFTLLASLMKRKTDCSSFAGFENYYQIICFFGFKDRLHAMHFDQNLHKKIHYQKRNNLDISQTTSWMCNENYDLLQLKPVREENMKNVTIAMEVPFEISARKKGDRGGASIAKNVRIDGLSFDCLLISVSSALALNLCGGAVKKDRRKGYKKK